MAQVPSDLTLRAIEWLNLPAFTSQLWAPLALWLLPWWLVVAVVFAAGGLWTLVRYQSVNLRLSSSAASAVQSFKWPIAVIGAVLAYKHQPLAVAALALLWPLAAALLSVPGKIGRVERNFAEATLRYRAAKAPPEE